MDLRPLLQGFCFCCCCRLGQPRCWRQQTRWDPSGRPDPCFLSVPLRQGPRQRGRCACQAVPTSTEHR